MCTKQNFYEMLTIIMIFFYIQFKIFYSCPSHPIPSHPCHSIKFLMNPLNSFYELNNTSRLTFEKHWSRNWLFWDPNIKKKQKNASPTKTLITTIAILIRSSKHLGFTCGFKLLTLSSTATKDPLRKESAWNKMSLSYIFVLTIQILNWNLANVNWDISIDFGVFVTTQWKKEISNLWTLLTTE